MPARLRHLLIAPIAFVCAVAVFGSVPQAAPATPTESSTSPRAMTVTDLRTEYAENPLGIDVLRPRLSWVLGSTERGQAQTAYQIQVATSTKRLHADRPDVWNSDKVRSSDSIGVVYGGPALESATRYHWRVRVWDADGRRSDWSKPAWWETGLLEASDWRAEWIGRPAEQPTLDLEGAHWIWYPEGNPAEGAPAATRFFRARFEVPAEREVTRATLTATADDNFVASVNGEQVASGTNWTRAIRSEVAEQLTAGTNVLAIAAGNNGGAAGLIGRLRIEFASGEPLVVDTGAGFKAMNVEQSGWTDDDDFDDSGWSDALEVAAFGEGPWTCCGGVQPPRSESVSSQVLRKHFSAGKPVVSARAYVTGMGYYELRINGRRIGHRVLDPTYTEYEDTVLYATYDVTRNVREGGNLLEVTLAPGFYYYDAAKLLMQLQVTYADGTTEVVATGRTWQAAAGPTTFDTGTAAEVFGGETYDARHEPSDWEDVELVSAPGGRLVASAIEPVTVAETVEPTDVAEPLPGTYVVDMGRTLTGWIRLRAAGESGTKVSIQYGEKLNPDGTVNAVAEPGPRPRWQRDEYVFRGDPVEVWEPSFTFKSFRYMQLDGLAEPPDEGTVRGRVVHSDVAVAGEFSSSSQLYDRIHHAMRRASLGGLLGYPAVDPAHEKNGWTGDLQLITPSLTDNFGMARFLTKWLGDIRDSQRPDGSISMIAPIRDGCCYAWAPEWTGAYPIVAWELFLRYGDRRVLESHYEALVRYLRSQTDSLADGIAPPSTWGDWAAPGYSYAPEDRRLTATAYVYRQTMVMADIATRLGHDDDAGNFRATAETVKARFNEEFLNEEAGRYETALDPGYRQASNAIPLAFGMVPASAEQAVLQGLVNDVRARGDHLNTGILGTPALLEVLTRYGHADLAHAIASQTTYPSWGEWIEAGADTMWEAWGLDGRSRNHPMHGTVDDWFYRAVAGIAPTAPGYKRVLIQPHMGSLTQARAEHESPYGAIESAWTVDDGRFALRVTIPVNTTATVYVPTADPSSVTESGEPADDAEAVRYVGSEDGYAVYEVGSGTYLFQSDVSSTSS